MSPMMGLLGIVLAAFAFCALVWWLERVTRRPGLGFACAGATGLVGAVIGFVDGNRLLPAAFLVEAIGLLYIAFLQQKGALTARTGAAEESKAA